MKSHIRRLKNSAHLVLALTANKIHGYPSRGMIVVGVTGTDGKTTTSNLIYHILKSAGKKTALISTLGAVIDGEKYETGFHVTTPSPFSVQKYIKLAKQKGCSYLVLEVTSHALDQNRVYGVRFNVGVLTNVTHEHLDYHKSYENYVDAKLKLLKKSEVSVVNSHGEWFERVKKEIPKEKLLTYSLHGKNDTLSLSNLPYEIKTNLLGEFNKENILAAVLTCLSLKIDEKAIFEAIESFKAPVGRQEVLCKNPLVMVDFAHTPNSFERVLPLLRANTKGRLIHVFGSAGERDRKKRPVMGEVASIYDDIIILTAEDPRREKVENINNDIKKGIKKGKKLYEINNRREAIKFALELSNPDDTIVITGKGHERSMNLGHGEIEWSDQEAIREFIK